MIQLELVDTSSGARRSVPLTDRGVLIGSAIDCDLVLPGATIAAHQCRVEPAGHDFRLLHLAGEQEGETLLNGKAVGRANLRVGDVLKVGSFQITVVPQAAPRPAAKPVPAAPPARSAIAAPGAPASPAPPRPATRPMRAAAGRGSRDDARPPPRSRRTDQPAVVLGGLVMVALVIAAFIFLRGGPDDPGGSDRERLEAKLAEARRFSDDCRFDEALRVAGEVIGACSGGGLAGVREAATALERTARDRKERYQTGRTRLDALRARVARDMTGETVGEISRFAAQYSDLDPLREEILTIEADLKERVKRAAAPDLEGITLPADRNVADCVTEADKWLAKSEFAKAMFVLRSVKPRDEAEKKQRKEALARVNAAARTAGEEILRRVQEHLELGHVLQALGEFEDDNLRTLKGTDVWYDLLEKADEVEDVVDMKIPEHARPVQRRKHSRKRPQEEEESAADENKSGRAEATAPARAEPTAAARPSSDRAPPAAPPPPEPGPDPPHDPRPGSARTLREEARALLAKGDFAPAEELLELALDRAAPADDPGEIARDLERAARPRKLASRVAELLAANPPSAAPELRLRDGRRGRLVRSGGTALVLLIGGAETGVPPAALEPRSLLDLSGRMPLSAEESLDRAFLALACGDDKAFFASLDRAARDAETGDLTLRGSIDSALAFQRGLDRVPPRGFVRDGERWLTWAERAEEELRREVAAAISAALAPQADPARAGEKALEIARTAPDLVRSEIARQRAALARSFSAAPEQEKLAKLHARAVELRTAREHALALIFDEAKYFYPYQPPECPPDRAATYAQVQQEVDRRVDAVRAIWGREEVEPPEPHVSLSPQLCEDVRRLKTLRALRSDLALPRDDEDVALRGAWCLPVTTRSAHLRNFALDEYERARLDQDAKVMALNASAQPQDGGVTRAELDQVLETNRYRAMLGRRVLAWNAKLWTAARGHSDWMSRTGRLTHFEDDPARETFEQRIRLAGYEQGAGENCAAGRDGPREVLHRWQHSSGHHRNLLYESHTELGSGQSGSFWTQCFGGGREYRGNLVRD